MGKRHTIVARKTAGDAKKSQNYAKIGKIIQMAAKNGSDPSMNPKLELALQKAKYYSLPRDVIDRAIKKGSGQLDSEAIEEYVYEGYGPGGTAILIKTLTENTNRTNMNIKTTLGKMGGSLGKQGSVAWQFEETGVFLIDGKSEILKEKGKEIEKIQALDDDAEMEIMELAIEDIENESGQITVSTTKENFSQVQKGLIENSFHIVEGDLHFLANDLVTLDSDGFSLLEQLIGQLENNEDVNVVYHNGTL